MSEQINDLTALRTLLAQLQAGRQDYDFQPPSLLSHVSTYRKDAARLKRYAGQVIPARIMLLLASTRMTTQALLHGFLLGVDEKTPFPMLLAARAQLELLSVVADAVRRVRENEHNTDKDFADRVEAVDNALINATYGTRSSVLLQLLPKIELSAWRAPSEEDIQVLTSRSVLTRLDKLAKSGAYPTCKEDYERLCEYVHPNWGMNMLHLVPSPLDSRLLRLSLSSEDAFKRAFIASAATMNRATHATIDAFEGLQPPFGMTATVVSA